MQCAALTCRGSHTTELLTLLLKQDTFINQDLIGPHLTLICTLWVLSDTHTQDSLELYHPHRQGHTAHDVIGPSSLKSVAGVTPPSLWFNSARLSGEGHG